jgi:hypothetical protein
MNEKERQTLADTIDLALSLARLTIELRQRVKALENLLLQPNTSQPQVEIAEANERGGRLYEDILAATDKLSAAQDLFRNDGSIADRSRKLPSPR